MTAETCLLSIDQLSPHPDNPRRLYRPEEIEALAQSIQEMDGVEQALIVVPGGHLADGRPAYLVVDGNYRLAAARSLPAPPRLKCEIRPALSRREVLLVMARTSVLWFAKDAISEALHYRKLLDEEGFTRLALARKLGHSQGYLAARLRLLDLDPEIQELVAQGELTKDPRLVDALLSIEDSKIRLHLARELAKRRATLKACLAACARLRETLASSAREGRVQAARRRGWMPSLLLAEEALETDLPESQETVAPGRMRASARGVCAACDIRQQSFPHLLEPAWSLVCHAADDTCQMCSLVEIRNACGGCPLPEMLTRLAKMGAGTQPGRIAIARQRHAA